MLTISAVSLFLLIQGVLLRLFLLCFILHLQMWCLKSLTTCYCWAAVNGLAHQHLTFFGARYWFRCGAYDRLADSTQRVLITDTFLTIPLPSITDLLSGEQIYKCHCSNRHAVSNNKIQNVQEYVPVVVCHQVHCNLQ